MSVQNNNTLPKIWQIADIVYHISLFSGTATSIALTRTCKMLCNYIISCNSLWHKLYRNDFSCDVNTDVDWLEWQLEQEQIITVAAIDAKNGTASISIWFQRYRQRINMGMNWQKNKPTSTVYLEPFNTDIVEDPKFAKQTIIATYPGWIAIAAFKHFQIDLINLSTKNVVKIYPLGMDNSRLEILEKITFYQHRQQANDIDDGMRLILHLKYDKASFSVLQYGTQIVANYCSPPILMLAGTVEL